MDAQQKIISSEEFRPLAGEAAAAFLGLAGLFGKAPAPAVRFPQVLYGHITTEARMLEDFLDNCGARNNTEWRLLRELAATARLFGFCAYTLQHILNRYDSYRLLTPDSTFKERAREINCFFKTTLVTTCGQACAEAQRLGIAPDEPPDDRSRMRDMPTGLRLANDIGDEELACGRDCILQVARSYHMMCQDFRSLSPGSGRSGPALKTMVLTGVEEQTVRQFVLRAQNMQSKYDTYIKDTARESRDNDLKTLREHISIAVHLLEIAERLIHFYERHQGDIRKSPGCAALDLIADKDKILDTVFNWALDESRNYLEAGNPAAHGIITRYARASSIEVPIPPYLGFHVRPSARLQKIVQYNGARVRLIIEEQAYDAGNALELFTANERIRALKRKHIFASIRPELYSGRCGSEAEAIVAEEVGRLAGENVVILQGSPGAVQVSRPESTGPLTQSQLRDFIKQSLWELMSRDSIDARHENIMVVFEGDEEVLEHIKLLAEHGYGEDEQGRDTPLPRELFYLYS